MSAWLAVLPIALVASLVIVSLGADDKPAAGQARGSCAANDHFCAPIYDPSVEVITIGPSTTDARIAVTGGDLAFQAVISAWIVGLLVLAATWLIVRFASKTAQGWRGLRRMTWALGGWIALCAVVLIVAIAVPTPERLLLSDAARVGLSEIELGLGALVGFYLLGVLWLVTWQRRASCPTCGEQVGEQERACINCGRRLVVSETLRPSATVNGTN